MYAYVARGKTMFVSFNGKYRTIVVISAKSVRLHYGVDGRHTGKLNWLIVRNIHARRHNGQTSKVIWMEQYWEKVHEGNPISDWIWASLAIVCIWNAWLAWEIGSFNWNFLSWEMIDCEPFTNFLFSCTQKRFDEIKNIQTRKCSALTISLKWHVLSISFRIPGIFEIHSIISMHHIPHHRTQFHKCPFIAFLTIIMNHRLVIDVLPLLAHNDLDVRFLLSLYSMNNIYK